MGLENMLESVKHDRTLGLAPIFKPLKTGERSKSKLDVRIESGNDKIRIVCFEPLGPDDQTVFFSILALCTNEQRGLILGVEPSSNDGKQLRNDLFKGKDSDRDSIMVEASEYEILTMCGKSDGRENYRHLRETLMRLSSVTIHVETLGEQYPVRLLATYIDKETRHVKIAVNNRSAAAILGNQYAYISLAEHIRLSYEPGKILHGWLSSWLPQGSERRITAAKLASHVYPNYETVSETSKRTYRSNAKRAALSLIELGWRVTIEGRGGNAMYIIGRPSKPLVQLASDQNP